MSVSLHVEVGNAHSSQAMAVGKLSETIAELKVYSSYQRHGHEFNTVHRPLVCRSNGAYVRM